MSKKFYIANWKMNMLVKESEIFFKTFLSLYKSDPNKEVVFCPPFTTFPNLIDKYGDFDMILFGGQNVSSYKSGAHTGEISANMLKESLARYCIVGHSERRNLYNETNREINGKIKNLIDNSITPILCVGEKLDDRENMRGEEIVLNQLSVCLQDIEKKQIIIAYEPVWAIGTGENASINDISSMNTSVKKEMNNLGYIDDQFYILYGGSVNIDNLLDIKDASFLDGFLIGGASLDPKVFWEIIDK